MSLVLVILTSIALGAESLPAKQLLACANEVTGRSGPVVRAGPERAIVTTFDDGWVLRTYEPGRAYRCRLPAAVEACFRANPNCRAFDLLLAHPEPGVRLTFDGTSIDDHRRVERLKIVAKLEAGTVDAKGRVRKVVRGQDNPILGLECRVDQSPAADAALEFALGRVLAARDASLPRPIACRSLDIPKMPRALVPPAPEPVPAAR